MISLLLYRLDWRRGKVKEVNTIAKNVKQAPVSMGARQWVRLLPGDCAAILTRA
jgi:hypothetical protein